MHGDLWQPDETNKTHAQPWHFFTPEEIHQCFIGKRIVFQGDSMIRQIMTRLVFYLRMYPTMCEHQYHFGTARYYAFKNGSGASSSGVALVSC